MDTVVLDQGSEPWVATLRGLGSVLVHADGTVDVDVSPSASGVTPPDDGEDPRWRERALRCGWGEPLSLVRRGFRLLWGTALVAPGRRGCVVFTGSANHTAMVTSQLLASGYRPLADAVVPVTIGDDGTPGDTTTAGVMAHPRTAPLLLPRRWARKAGLEGEKVRSDTDAVAMAVDLATTPEPVVGVALVRVRRPHDEIVRQLTGFEPFEQAAAVLIATPALCPPTLTPADEMAKHRCLATVAHAEIGVRTDSLTDDLAAITTWWEGLEPR